MSTERWRCPGCRHVLAPQFNECWQCGYLRGSGGDETVDPGVPDPMTCPRCHLDLEFIGTRRFREGSQASSSVLDELGEMFLNRQSFDIYVCVRCGRVEFFVEGIGEEFRDA